MDEAHPTNAKSDCAEPLPRTLVIYTPNSIRHALLSAEYSKALPTFLIGMLIDLILGDNKQCYFCHQKMYGETKNQQPIEWTRIGSDFVCHKCVIKYKPMQSREYKCNDCNEEHLNLQDLETDGGYCHQCGDCCVCKDCYRRNLEKCTNWGNAKASATCLACLTEPEDW